MTNIPPDYASETARAIDEIRAVPLTSGASERVKAKIGKLDDLARPTKDRIRELCRLQANGSYNSTTYRMVQQYAALVGGALV